MLLRDLLSVFVGAGLGGVLRWGISLMTASCFGVQRFPLATLFANILACSLAGLLLWLSAREGRVLENGMRLFLFSGFLGGLSTMSAFSLETVLLLKRGEWIYAGTNFALTLALCMGSIFFFLRKMEGV